MKFFEINEQERANIANYLGTRPYNESAPLIGILAKLPEVKPELKELEGESE